jgi:uncharacterized protein (TIGR02145 family)
MPLMSAIGTTGTFTDPRDGRTYKTVVMPDGMEWLAENLNYNQPGSVFYNNDPSLGDIYGRLYTWQQAMDAVPEGWRLPTRLDWFNLLGAVSPGPEGIKLKASPPRWDGTDEFGFAALPGGAFDPGWGGSFEGIGINGGWWISEASGTTQAWRRYMLAGNDWFMESIFFRSTGYSVRLCREVQS